MFPGEYVSEVQTPLGARSLRLYFRIFYMFGVFKFWYISRYNVRTNFHDKILALQHVNVITSNRTYTYNTLQLFLIDGMPSFSVEIVPIPTVFIFLSPHITDLML